MPIIITPGAFTRPASLASLAERLGAQIVARPQHRKVQFDTGGIRSIAAALDCAIRDLCSSSPPAACRPGHFATAWSPRRAGYTKDAPARY